MAIDVTARADINAPPATVANIQFDPKRDAEWIGGVDRVELVTDPPTAVGSQVRRLGGFMGRPIEWLMRVEEFEPERHVGMHALQAPFPMDVDYRLEPIDDGRRTRASIRIRGDAAGMYGAMPGPLMGWMVRRSVQGDLKRLKRIVESDPHPPPSPR
jgi:carbon monoxide dehydrogenase subunit G